MAGTVTKTLREELTAVTLTRDEAKALAREAYIYLYPLVLMDVTRRQATNAPAGQTVGRGPANEFVHIRTYPPAEFKDVVRPNFDTLYSIAWLDLTNGPLLVSVPDTAGRYYLLPLLDMWTEVFAVPGKRTTGTTAKTFAVVPPKWDGELPDGVERIDTPTPQVWIIGRIQTNGAADYAAVNSLQDRMSIAPLTEHGHTVFHADPAVDMKTPPMAQVDAMSGKAFFAYAADIMSINPPHLVDQPILARIRRIGIVPGTPFDAQSFSDEIADAIDAGAKEGRKALDESSPTLARVVNGWQMNTDTMGVYGTYFIKRACIALMGLGANPPEDAVYPLNLADADGKPLDGKNTYVLHFEKQELPPVDAFWSVTMYGPEGFAYPNPINRCAIGDRDRLQFNKDGSLDLYFQHSSPGSQKESNWLPSPAGAFNLTMRLYYPRPAVTEGHWAPPPVKRT